MKIYLVVMIFLLVVTFAIYISYFTDSESFLDRETISLMIYISVLWPLALLLLSFKILSNVIKDTPTCFETTMNWLGYKISKKND